MGSDKRSDALGVEGMGSRGDEERLADGQLWTSE